MVSTRNPWTSTAQQLPRSFDDRVELHGAVALGAGPGERVLGQFAADASATAPGVDGEAGIGHVHSRAGMVGVERGRAGDGTGVAQDEGQVRRGLHPVRSGLVLRDVARPAEGLSSLSDLAEDGPSLAPVLERCVCGPHGIEHAQARQPVARGPEGRERASRAGAAPQSP